MPTTRHTRASTTLAPSTSPLPTTSADPKTQKALDKLVINAKGALSGEKVVHNEECEMYLYRGTWYEVDQYTDPKWLEDATEIRKRKRGGDEAHEGGESGARKAKRVKRRQSAVGDVTPGEDDEVPDSPPTKSSKKRAREALDDTASATFETGTDEPPTKRLRALSTAKSRPHARKKTTTGPGPDSAREIATPSSPSHCGLPPRMISAQRTARAKGYAVTAFTEAKIREGKLARKLVRYLAAIIPLNEEAGELQLQLQALERAAALRQARHTLPAPPKKVVEIRVPPVAATAPPIVEEEMDSPPSPLRHDSATPLPPPLPPPGPEGPAGPTAAPPSGIPPGQPSGLSPGLTLAPTNKAGDPLRWSLPSGTPFSGRAEESITRARIGGESHQARRRRVRRERAALKGWTVEMLGS